MEPRVTSVTTRNVLGPNNTVNKAIVLVYYVGQHGPFELVTNQVDINSGAASQALQNFANSLRMLPLAN